MKKIVAVIIMLAVPTTTLAETIEQEATRICSEYIKVKKECYYKAVKGVLPVNGVKSVKSIAPVELVETACQEGFAAFGRAGKQKAAVVNQGMQASFSQCYSGYIDKGACELIFKSLRNAKTEMESYYADNKTYPVDIPNRVQIAASGVDVFPLPGSGGEVYNIVGTHPKCGAAYGTTNEITEILPASTVNTPEPPAK